MILENIKLKVVIFPDGSMVMETKKPFKKFGDCSGFLVSLGFVKDDHHGNVCRFTSSLASAFVIEGERTHPYSDPRKRLYSISIYPKAS